jgi:hypothetical protein
MTALTIYALFFDDLRMMFFHVEDDDIFYSITSAALFFFAYEICLASYAKFGYWNSFFFWLDVVSTLSLIPDIGWIMDAITG